MSEPTNNNILSEPQVMYGSRAGVNRQKVNEIILLTGITLAEMGQYAHVTPRTLQRKNPTEKLPIDISERVLLIQNLYYKGAAVFGTIEAFRLWMSQPNIPLGNVVPKTLLDSFTGISIINNLLGRIEHGFVA